MKSLYVVLSIFLLSTVLLVASTKDAKAGYRENLYCKTNSNIAKLLVGVQPGTPVEKLPVIASMPTVWMGYSVDYHPFYAHPYEGRNWVSVQYHPVGAEFKCAALFSRNENHKLMYWGVEEVGTHAHGLVEIATVGSSMRDSKEGYFVIAENNYSWAIPLTSTYTLYQAFPTF